MALIFFISIPLSRVARQRGCYRGVHSRASIHDLHADEGGEDPLADQAQGDHLPTPQGPQEMQTRQGLQHR